MSTWSRMVNLINKGEKVRCTRTGTYYHLSETNPDGDGGRISKIHDVFIHDQSVEHSKFKGGHGWQRGIK